MIRIATVFSGIGAAEEAIKLLKVDAQIVFACDNGERYLKETKEEIEATLPGEDNPVAREEAVRELYRKTKRENFVEKSYQANHHIHPSRWFQDVRFLPGKQFKGKVDLFVGGSPCQSFSTYGKKAGLNDARGTLFYEYGRLVQEIQPAVFIYENVKGLRSHDNGETWRKMKEIFEGLNYDISEAILDSVHYGLPQYRQRMFVVGIRKDVPHAPFSFPQRKRLRKKVPKYLEANVPDEYYLPEKGFNWVTDTVRNDNKARCNREIIGCQTAVQQVNWSGDFRIEPPKPSHRNNPSIWIGSWNGMKEAVARRLMPCECFRLMGFKKFRIVVPDRAAYRQAGNSIAVPVIQAIIQSIFDAVPSLNERVSCSRSRKRPGKNKR